MPPAARILCFGPFPVLQRTFAFEAWHRDAVNRAGSVTEGPGGKAVHAACAVAALGGRPLLAAFFGGGSGRRVAAALRARGIALLPVRTEAPTRLCQTLLDARHGDATELVEEAELPPVADWRRLQRLAAGRARGAGALVLAGSLPPGAPVALYRRLTSAAAGRPVVLDTHGPPLLEALAARPLVAKPNATELARTVGRRALDDGGLLRAAQRLLRQGAQHVLVTDGPRPVLWASPAGLRRISVPRVRCVNPIGAGDVLAGALALALASGEPMEAAVRLGVAAAAASCLERGSGAFDPAEAAHLRPRVRIEAA